MVKGIKHVFSKRLSLINAAAKIITSPATQKVTTVYSFKNGLFPFTLSMVLSNSL
jgi:hypothetical protein